MRDKDKKRLIEEVRESDEYAAFKRLVKRATENLDLEKDKQECLALHASRSSRSLYGKGQFNPTKVGNASAIDLNARSRLVEIRVRARANLSVIEKATKAMKQYIISNYSSELATLKTKDQREAFLDHVLRKTNVILSDGEALIELIDYLIKDLDQAGYNLKNLVEVLKLLAGNGSNIV